MKKFYCLFIGSLSQAYGGPYYGTQYDLTNACNHCGTGAKPIGKTISSGLDKKKKNIFENLDGEVFLDLQLAKDFSNLEINTLAEVISPRGMKFPFMEMREEATLPPFSNKTTGVDIEGQCSHCKRDGHFGSEEAPNIVYEKLSSHFLQKDILATYEGFGNSCLRKPFKQSVFASPRYIISQRIVNLFKAKKVRKVDFVPVTILDSE